MDNDPASPLAATPEWAATTSERTSLRWPVVLLFIAGFLVYFGVIGRTSLLNDADTLWHTAVGRQIFESGFRTTDVFSFTAYNRPWIANQWLAECLLALFDWLAGFDGILWWTTLILTTCYVMVSLRFLARGLDPVLTVAFIALVVSASAYTLHARPHIFSIVGMGITFALLRRFEERDHLPLGFAARESGLRQAIAASAVSRETAERSLQVLPRLAWLVPLFVLWSNLHGGVLGGLGTLGLVAAGWTALWLVGLPSPIRGLRDAGYVWTITVACAAAMLLTPFGSGSVREWIRIMRLPLQQLVTEHAPLEPYTSEGILVVILLAVYAGVFAATPRAWLRATFWLPIVWFVLACSRVRHAPLFAITTGIALADLLPQSRLAPWLRQRSWLSAGPPLELQSLLPDTLGDADRQRRKTRAPRGYGLRVFGTVLAGMSPLLAMAIWIKHAGPVPVVGHGWARPASRIWPSGMIAPLREFDRASPPGAEVFNEPILGGFLIYNFPNLRVFIDGRCELYGERFLREFVGAWEDPSKVAQWQSQYGFRAALIEADSPLRTYFEGHPQWALIHQTDTCLLYALRG